MFTKAEQSKSWQTRFLLFPVRSSILLITIVQEQKRHWIDVAGLQSSFRAGYLGVPCVYACASSSSFFPRNNTRDPTLPRPLFPSGGCVQTKRIETTLPAASVAC